MTSGVATQRATDSVTESPLLQRRPDPSIETNSVQPSFSTMVPASLRIQASSLRVSHPSDSAEREAESVSDRVVGGSSGSSPVAVSCAPAAGGAPARSQDASDLRDQMGGGSPLPPAVAKSMGEKFNADFSGVKIHTDNRAASLANRFAAKAFTVGGHVFFSRGAFQPGSADGQKLIAHELTHTIQQGAARQRGNSKGGAPAIARTAAPAIQRLGISDALDYFADKANLIPGFRMLTLVIGVNPVNMSRVERTAANVLRAIVEFIPGGGLITQALDNHGIFEKAGAWASQQLRTLGDIGASIKQALKNFIDGLSWSDIFDLGGVWDRAKRIFTDPVTRIKDFVVGLVTGFVTLIKDAILRPIGALAKGTEGWKLLCAVLGKDPITGEAVPRDAETLIGGFMKLIGQSEVWENMKKANAISRAFTWFKGAMSALIAFASELPQLFITAFTSLELSDIILLPRAFLKVGRVFGGFLARFVSWAGNAVWNLLEIIFDCVSPGAWGHIKKTGAALKSILKNPLPFMKNLVKAGIKGFEAFKTNFGKHLQAGLIDWLTGSLPGVYIPKSFAIKELVTFVLSVLGISWQMIRTKLVKVIGEPAMVVLEKTFDIVVILVRDGPAAAWEKIKEELGNLKEMVVDGIIGMVTGLIVQKAVPKLIAMFIPGAGFISAILAIYDTVMVFVQKISKIIQVVTAFVNSIVAIAAGNIGAAVAKVESILAGLLGLAINFLMGFAGLGKIADKVMGVITKIRAKVDGAIDKVIAWIVKQGKALFAKAKNAVKNWWKKKRPFSTASGERHNLYVRGEGSSAKLTIESTPTVYSDYIAALKLKYKTKLTDAAANKLVDMAKKLDEKVGATSSPSKTLSEADATKAQTEYEAAVAALASETTKVLDKLKIKEPSTPPVFGGLSGGFGVSARVEKLTNLTTSGSNSPTAGGAHWETLSTRKDRSKSYYVRGHLLHDGLGGPGDAWQNLAPLTERANKNSQGAMYKNFEKGLVDAFKSDDTLVLKFNVTASGAASIAPFKESEMSSVPLDADDKEKLATINAIRAKECFVPSSVSCSATKIEGDAKTKVPSSVVISNVIDTRFSTYYIETTKNARQEVSINLHLCEPDKQPALAAKAVASLSAFNLSPSEAAEVVKTRGKTPFANKESAYARLGSALYMKIVSTPRLKPKF